MGHSAHRRAQRRRRAAGAKTYVTGSFVALGFVAVAEDMLAGLPLRAAQPRQDGVPLLPRLG